jgi:phage terminase small subunit
MVRGRKPIPTATKRLAGTLRKDRVNHEEPTIEAGTPTPPEGMNDQARAQWDYYAPILSGCRVLTLADRETLACYCTAAGRREMAEAELAKHGPVVKSPSG